MSTNRLSRWTRGHVVWLLSAALLLPIAQTAATWHLLSQACADRSHADSRPLTHPARCDFCLTAVGLNGGASAGGTVALPRPIGLHETPAVFASPLVSAAPASGYRSRAPPVASS